MNAKKGSGSLNGFLDRGARLEGTISFDEVFRIDGQFKGTITSDAELVVGEGGVVEGDVRVGRLAVSGTIKGSIHATERVELHAGARVFADIRTPILVVEEGAVIQGPVESGPPRAEEPAKDQMKNSIERIITDRRQREEAGSSSTLPRV